MVDRISNLPDELLYHILSFLPTEDACATSLVSKGFRPLCLSVPTLDFDEGRYRSLVRRHSSFSKFVSAFILRRGIHQPIKTFRLKCLSCPDLQVKTWLNIAAGRKVENLQFYFSRGLQINFYSWMSWQQELPCSIFSITTLVVLKLHYVAFKDFSSVELPSLKALHLDFVTFSKSQHFIDLLNGCPLLEILEVQLVDFDFVDDPSSGRKFTTLSKLVRADFSHMLKDFYLPVRIFYNVEFLRIGEFCDEDIPIFPNLIHLDLIFRRNLKWESVLDMLNHCPQLQTFHLQNLYRAPYMVWPNTHVVPECFSSQLRKCCLTEFKGTECEMTFAKFVLQNSKLLHTMKIFSYLYLSRYLSHEKILEMRKELNSCPRSSASCELLFPDDCNCI